MNAISDVDRRRLLQLGAAVPALGMAGTAPAFAAAGESRLNLSSPADNLRTYVKLVGSLAETVLYVSFGGILWGIAPDRQPIPLCGFQGLARSNWMPKADGSFLQKSFDVGYFSDLETGKPLDELINPLTGETVAPFHYKYGGGETLHTETGQRSPNAEAPQSSEPFEPKWTTVGHQVWLTELGGGEVDNPIPPDAWPRESSGDKYQWGSETNLATTIEQLTDTDVQQADYTLFWSSVGSWEPWLLMGSAPGFNMWRAVGTKLRSYDEAPEQMLKFIAEVQPNYFEDDDPWTGTISSFDRFKDARKPAG